MWGRPVENPLLFPHAQTQSVDIKKPARILAPLVEVVESPRRFHKDLNGPVRNGEATRRT
jgi:hypothetical protein